MATSRIAEHVGRVLGDRYRLTRPLGTGASAHVYVAEDVTLRRRVAVKLLHPGLADDEGFLRRFQAEARVVAGLRHPNILRVYDWGEDDGAPFLVMELLEGGSMRSLLDRGTLLTPAQAAVIGADAARALDYAHRRGLVHRDIKPANLLFDEEGRVCIADFGLARALAEATWTEPAGAVLGTARYAAPEQVLGAALDGRADVYALALVLVEAVTGRVPFAADTTIGTLMARVNQPLVAHEELGPLGAVLERAGTPDPADRIDAGELARALGEVVPNLPPPGPLTLAGPLVTGEFDTDADVTELPGRPTLFDGEASVPGAGSPPRDGAIASGVGAAPGGTALSGGAFMTTAPATGEAATDTKASRRDRGDRGDGGDRGGVAVAAPPRQRRHVGRWLLAVLVAVAALAGGGYLYTRTVTPKHAVPRLIGDTEAAAGDILAPLHLHLHVATRPYDDTVTSGIILRQQPDTGALREGSSVSVDVSAGPPPVVVPDLTNLTEDQARQRLAGAGLTAGQVSSRPDTTVTAGHVITWSGKDGKLIKGSSVDVILSSGPPTVVVPDVHAKSFADAKAALAAIQLTAVEDDQFNDTVPKGQVVATNPPVNTTVAVGTQVTVTVSKGIDLVTVPDVNGQSVAAATRALEQAGLSVSGVSGSPDRPVTSTSPARGAMVKRGSPVKLFTS